VVTRVRLATTAALTAALVCGCTSSRGATSSDPPGNQPANASPIGAPTFGTIRGSFIDTTGLVRRLVTSGTVAAFSSGNSIHSQAIGQADVRAGQFTLNLPPGSYYLLGSPARLKDASCPRSAVLRVSAYRTTIATVTCDQG